MPITITATEAPPADAPTAPAKEKTTFRKALDCFERGQLGAGMTALALGLDTMAQRADTDEVRVRLWRCAMAASTFALEWAALSPPSKARHAELLTSAAAWVRCPDCEDFFCMIHGQHVHECACPPIEDWSVDPYSEGRRQR